MCHTRPHFSALPYYVHLPLSALLNASDTTFYYWDFYTIKAEEGQCWLIARTWCLGSVYPDWPSSPLRIGIKAYWKASVQTPRIPAHACRVFASFYGCFRHYSPDVSRTSEPALINHIQSGVHMLSFSRSIIFLCEKCATPNPSNSKSCINTF